MLRGSGFGLLVIGFVTGIVVTLLYFGFRDAPSPFGSGIRDVMERAAQGERDGGASSAPATSPEPALVEPDYDFYTILPEIEQVLPGAAPEPEAGAASGVPAPATKSAAASSGQAATQAPAATAAASGKASYVLQVGAYTRLQDADSVRARLALKGFESYTQKVSIEGRGTFYRVRLGPFGDRAASRAMQKRLGGEGVRSVSVKLGGGRGG